jgi:hypothetical protein
MPLEKQQTDSHSRENPIDSRNYVELPEDLSAFLAFGPGRRRTIFVCLDRP